MAQANDPEAPEVPEVTPADPACETRPLRLADSAEVSPLRLEPGATPPVAAVPPTATPVPLAPPFAAVAAALPAQPPPLAAPPPAVATPPAGAPWTGEWLRRAREARGLSVVQVAERTKITRHHLENLEADRHDRLPAPVYLRGILLALAKELRLDGQKVARSYLDAMRAAAGGGK